MTLLNAVRPFIHIFLHAEEMKRHGRSIVATMRALFVRFRMFCREWGEKQ